MSDALSKILMGADGIHPPVLSFDTVDQWEDGQLERFVATGLLRPFQPAESLTCWDCGEVEEVLVLPNPETEQPDAYIRCAMCGPVKTPMERLKQWELSIEGLLDTVFADIKLVGRREEIVRDRVWRLGKARWAGASRSVFFARGLHRSDAWKVINEAKPTARSVVFVPARLPKADSRMEVNPVVIPLLMAVCENATGVGLDQEYVEAEIADVLVTPVGSDEPLGERAQLVLVAMLELGATDSDARCSTEDIAAKALGNVADANSLKSVMAELRTREFVSSKTGRGGGCWLTETGRSRSEKLCRQ